MFKVGDKVKVIGNKNTAGIYHDFNLQEIVCIDRIWQFMGYTVAGCSNENGHTQTLYLADLGIIENEV